jgi:SAM-dependent methyltransferase
VNDDERARHAASFDGASDAYDRARPGYPDDALAWLVPLGARDVLDLGAGTGKLTRQLIAPRRTVTAVEPLAGMRERLAAAVPDARLLAGDAEAIPLPDDGVDVVLVAQAWHWFDETRAGPEIARVLRPGGVLGLLWNDADKTEPWVAALWDLLHERGEQEKEDDPVPHPGPDFERPVRRDFRHRHVLDLDTLLDLVRSRSYVILLPEDRRRRLLDDVVELVRGHPDIADPQALTLPYVTQCWRTRRR